MPATDNQLNRTAVGTYDFEWRISLLPRREYVDNALFNAGEPVALPLSIPLLFGVTATSTTISTSFPYDTTDYPDSGMLNISDGVNWGWWSYTAKTSDTFTGVTFEHGFPTFAAGSAITAGRNVTDRVDIDALSVTLWKEGVFGRWAASMRGWDYDERLFMPDASVLIELRVTPDGAMGVWSDWMVFGLGYVRKWTPTGDADGLRPWVSRVVDVGTYVLPHMISARRYGRVNASLGGTVTTSPKLANPLLELLEFGDLGIGTTDGDNVHDTFNDTRYISELVPSMTPETPTGSGGIQDPLINQIVTQGVVQQPGLQWIEIGIAPDNPRYVSGFNLKDYYIRTKATVYTNGTSVVGGTLYIRGPDTVLNQDNDRIFLTNNAQWFREVHNINRGVWDWTRLDGFGNDQTPGRLLTLDPDGDIVQLRVEVNGVEPTVRDMSAYGDVNPNAYWLPFDNQGHWDNSTVTAPGVGESIRRSPVYSDSNETNNWIVETRVNPGDDQTDDDAAFISTEYNEWVAHLADNITNSSPATGEALELDDVGNLDREYGVLLIGAEKIAYVAATDADTTTDIIRGFGGTTPASHTTADLVYQFGRVEYAGIGLSSYMSAIAPANGGAIFFPTTSSLPDSGKLWLGRECIEYTGKTASSVTDITRAADGTTAAEHLIGTPVYSFDESLGAHRLPLIESIEIRRTPVRIVDGEVSTLRLVVPKVFDIWGSVVANPAYPGTADYRLDWLNYPNNYLVRVVLSPLQYSTQLVVDLPKPLRLRHRMMVIHQMSDNGRAKVNEILDWRAQIDRTSNGGSGMEAIVRDMVGEVLAPSEIQTVGYIGGGHPFGGTGGDLTTNTEELGAILQEVGTRHSLFFTFTLDGKLQISRNHFHPRGAFPDVTAVLDYPHIAAGMEVDIPSRFDVGQVIVEMIDPKTGARCEGRYPPNPGPTRVVRLPPLYTSNASPQNASLYAMQAYFKNPKISREFRFETMGPAEWLRLNQRLYIRDTSNLADADSGGRLWNVAVEQVEFTTQGNARVVAQEWRLP